MSIAPREHSLAIGLLTLSLGLGVFTNSARGISLSCGVSQLIRTQTSTVGGEIGAISTDGMRALLLSNENFTGANPDRNQELFLLDLTTRQFTQLTETAGAGWAPDQLTASGDLNRIAFRSQNGGGGPGGAFGLFLLELPRGEVRQLQAGKGGLSDVSHLVMSRDGSRIAFISADNLTGENPDEKREAFLYDIEEERLTQVTRLPSWTSSVSAISLDNRGGLIAVLKTHFNFSDIEVLSYPGLERKLIYSGQRFGDIFLSGPGDRLFFSADADPAGLNADGGPEIFMMTAEPNFNPANIRQLTAFQASQDPLLDSVAFSNDGKWIAFQSVFSWSPWNGHGARNIFLLEVDSGGIHQVTYEDTPFFGGIDFILSDDGSRLLFSSRSDPVGLNADLNREVFLAACNPAKVRFFPQIGNGVLSDRRITTQLVFSNTGPDASALIEFFDPSGNRLNLQLKDRGTGSMFHFSLRNGMPLLLETTGFGPLVVGYARITTSSSVDATAVFTGSLSGTNKILHEAAVPLTSPLSRFSIVVNTLGSYNTGLAMVNASSLVGPDQMEEPARVFFRLYDQSGNSLASRTLSLAPGTHRALFVTELFSQVRNVGEMVGLITATSEQPLAVISLRQNDDPNRHFPESVPTLTTFPVSPLPEEN